MGGWFETAGVILAVIAGVAGGRAFSRLKNPHWVYGYLLSLALIGLLLFSAHVNTRTFAPVFAWVSGGRVRFILIGLAATMGSMTLLGRLKRPFEKAVVFAMMIGVVIWGSVLPFFMPVLLRENLASLQTKMDADNVCVQSTNYTCGPAAAVTALRRLGLTAQEGEIAILSHSSPIAGTLPWCLYKAIQNRYASEGLDCQFRRFDSVSQLREADVTLVVVKDAFLLDHCVAVIEVGDETVTIADPVRGQTKMSYKDFEDVWRFYGIALKSGTTHKG
jgi:predicted double-glycine peptidase